MTSGVMSLNSVFFHGDLSAGPSDILGKRFAFVFPLPTDRWERTVYWVRLLFIWRGFPSDLCVCPYECVWWLAFFAALLPFYEYDRKCVILGDFNCARGSDDWLRPDAPIDCSARFLNQLVDQSDLLDIGKFLSWKNNCILAVFKRLLMLGSTEFVSISVARDISKYNGHPIYFIDHCLLTATISEKNMTL